MRFLVRALSGAMFILTPAQLLAAQAEEQVAPETKPQDDPQAIVVTGTRTRLPVTALPLTVDVVGGKDLTDQVAVSGSVIDAVSARLPAFSPTREKLSGAGETLRGRSPLFAINGVPQSTPIRDGSRDGYTIDPFFIDRVEVIYGSNALQGIGATGGVVNQVTVGAPLGDGIMARTLVQGTAQDGFDGEALGGKAAGVVGYRAGPFDLTGGATFERRGAFIDGHGNRIGVDGTQGDIQDSDSWSVFGRFGYRLSDTTRLELIANRFELEGRGHYVQVPGFPATSVKGDPAGAPPANRAELLNASLTQSELFGGDLTAQAFFSRTRDIFGGSITGTFQDPSIAPRGTLFDQSVNNSRKLGAKLAYERMAPGLEALMLTAGLDLLHDRTAQTLLATDRTWVPESSFFSVAPFLQGHLKLLDGKLRLAGGVRYEKVTLDVPDFHTLASTTFNGVDPATFGGVDVAGGKPSFHKALLNGGVIAEPVKGLRAYASYAEGYTIADVGRILRAIKDVGVDVDDFLSLEPIVSNNREIGVEWKRGFLTASAAYWWSSSELGSLLVRNPNGIFDVARQPIELEGLDLSLDVRTPIRGLNVGAAYARVRGKTDSNDADTRVNNDLDGANISPDRLNLYASYENGPFDARLAARFHFERKFDDASTASDFEGYALVDAAAGYRFGKHRLSLSAMNLLDKYYVSYNSDTVAATDPTRFFAGRGRTITLGLTSEF